MTGSGKSERRKSELRAFDPAPSAAAAAAALASLDASCALIGGLAMDAWGMERATKDLDLAVPLGVAEQASALMTARATMPLRIGGMAVRDPENDIRVDLIDRRFHFSALFAAAIEEARQSLRTVRVGVTELPLVSLEYLLAMKLVSGDPKDDADVRRILTRDDLDYAAARHATEQHLGPATANRLDAMAREAGRSEVAPRYI